MIKQYPDMYNDVFGPIMQPGSSSHTAAPCRLGYMANSLLGEPVKKIHVIMDSEGSFAGTFGSMSEDKGMIAGALGMLPNDERLHKSKNIAEAAGVEIEFEFGVMKESEHVNAMKFVLTGVSGKNVSLVGDSTNGGMVETRVVNGVSLRLIGDSHVVLVTDESDNGVVELGLLEKGFKDVVGSEKIPTSHGVMYCIKMSSEQSCDWIGKRFPTVEVHRIRPVLPILISLDKQEQLFDTMTAWRKIAKDKNMRFSEVAIEYQKRASGWTRDQVVAYMNNLIEIMHRQVRVAYEENTDFSGMPIVGRHDIKWNDYLQTRQPLSGGVIAQAIKNLWSVALFAVEQVPGPMGGGGGCIYASMHAVKEAHGFSDEDFMRGLFVAGGVGTIAYTRTNPTGEVIGCAGEHGIAAAMAAAAITEMAGGTPEQVENAASLTLQTFIGSPCDPIPGGNMQPCMSRGVAGVTTAITFADVALSGRDALLPFHEVLDATDQVGRMMPEELLCTSRGGCAAAPSAVSIKDKYLDDLKSRLL